MHRNLISRSDLTVVPPRPTVNNESVIDPLVRARVTKLREDKGWTQAHLARAAEVATNTVGGLEGDRHTRPAQLTRIAAALQVSLQALRTGAGLDENPFTKKLKLSDEDLRMAKRFHDAETEIRLATLRLLAAGRHDPMFTLWTRLQSLDETRRDFLLKALSEYEEALAREKAEKANRRMKKKR